MPNINYGTTIIHYSQYKQDRSDIKIVVDLVNGVIVYTPEKVTDNKLRNILEQKAPWITKKLHALNEVNTTVPPKEFINGEKLPYLGRHYRLKVHRIQTDKATIELKQGTFIAHVPEQWKHDQIQVELENKLIAWYHDHGLPKLLKRAAYYQQLLGVTPVSIRFKTQHKRWGTCTPEGHIYINW